MDCYLKYYLKVGEEEEEEEEDEEEEEAGRMRPSSDEWEERVETRPLTADDKSTVTSLMHCLCASLTQCFSNALAMVFNGGFNGFQGFRPVHTVCERYNDVSVDVKSFIWLVVTFFVRCWRLVTGTHWLAPINALCNDHSLSIPWLMSLMFLVSLSSSSVWQELIDSSVGIHFPLDCYRFIDWFIMQFNCDYCIVQIYLFILLVLHYFKFID